ncbi:DUF3376 domain-containing protein [Kocuria sp. U4B]
MAPEEQPAPGLGLPLTVVPPSRSLEAATAGRAPAFGRTLRCALALRGGVSLAVWIGGAVAELDVLRRIRIHRDGAGGLHAYLLQPAEAADPRLAERAAVYAGLLAGAGYDRVEFDVLAGASAGGLNAVVHAVAQRAGAGLDPLGRLWEDTAGLSRLLRPLGPRPVDSMLRGDGYLWPRLAEVLAAVHTGPEHHPDLVAEHVTVELSATVLDSDPTARGEAAEGRGDFHFASPDPGSPAPPLGNGIPARPPRGAAGEAADDEAERAAALSRIAYAARATASFPGAFEPAAVWSAATSGPLRNTPRPDLSHAFSAHRAPEELPYRVVDGGVFDNVPIDRAIEAARTRRSLRHADRCLLYLDPDPPHRAGPPSRHLDLPRLVRTLGVTLTRLRRRETGEDEVLALSDLLAEQLVERGRRSQLAPLLDEWGTAQREERRRAHLRYRARADAHLLGAVLTRPAEWQLTSTLASRSVLRARTPAELAPLTEELVRRGDALSRGPLGAAASRAVLGGPQALVDAASCVLSWVRFLEDLAPTPERTPAPLRGLDSAPARAGAYRVLAAAVHERDKVLRDVLAATAAPSAPVEAAAPVWLRPVALEDWWAELDTVVDGLRALHPALEAAAGAPGAEDWRALWCESPWRRIPAPPAALGAPDLPPALAAAGIPGTVSGIAYGEIRGDQLPSRPADVPRLRRGWADQRIQRALDAAGAAGATDAQLREVLAADPGRLPAGSKLAGTGLANFRGFLATAWRTNDWWWGRLDAAAGVAGFLRGLPARPAAGTEGSAEPAVPAAEHTGPAAEPPAVQGLQESLLRQLGDGDADRARGVLGGGADGLDRLAPGYRIALASRSLRVLGRALAGTPDLPRGVWELGLFLLQPLLVLAPLLLTPVRAALALVVGAAALRLGAAPAPDGSTTGSVLVVLAASVLGLSLVRTAGRSRRRWTRVLAAAGASPPRPRAVAGVPTADTTAGDTTAGDVTAADVAAARRGAVRRAAVSGTAAAALLLPAAAWASSGSALALLLTAVLVLDRTAAALCLRVPGRGAADEVLRAGGVVLAAVGAWALGALALVLGDGLPWVPGTVPARAAVVALAAAGLGALVLTGFLRPAWAALLSLAAGAAAGGAAALVWSLAGAPGQAGAGLPAAAAAVLAGAAVLWWAPAEGMLCPYGPEDELVPARPAGRPRISWRG